MRSEHSPLVTCPPPPPPAACRCQQTPIAAHPPATPSTPSPSPHTLQLAELEATAKGLIDDLAASGGAGATPRLRELLATGQRLVASVAQAGQQLGSALPPSSAALPPAPSAEAVGEPRERCVAHCLCHLHSALAAAHAARPTFEPLLHPVSAARPVPPTSLPRRGCVGAPRAAGERRPAAAHARPPASALASRAAVLAGLPARLPPAAAAGASASRRTGSRHRPVAALWPGTCSGGAPAAARRLAAATRGGAVRGRSRRSNQQQRRWWCEQQQRQRR